jgi:hypothetical protein
MRVSASFIQGTRESVIATRFAKEFGTKEEMDAYMKEHPDADHSNHTLKKAPVRRKKEEPTVNPKDKGKKEPGIKKPSLPSQNNRKKTDARIEKALAAPEGVDVLPYKNHAEGFTGPVYEMLKKDEDTLMGITESQDEHFISARKNLKKEVSDYDTSKSVKDLLPEIEKADPEKAEVVKALVQRMDEIKKTNARITDLLVTHHGWDRETGEE